MTAKMQEMAGAGGQSMRDDNISPPMVAKTPQPQPTSSRERTLVANIAPQTAGAISRMKTSRTPAMRTEDVITIANER